MQENYLNLKQQLNGPSFEESDCLAQNMVNQNLACHHQFLNNQSQINCQGDQSLFYPQSFSNLDKQLQTHQFDNFQALDQNDTSAQVNAQKQINYYNLIYDTPSQGNLKSEIQNRKQQEYPYSSRSINIESGSDFQRFNHDFANRSQISIKMRAHSNIQRKRQTQNMISYAKQWPKKEEGSFSQIIHDDTKSFEQKTFDDQTNNYVKHKSKKQEAKKLKTKANEVENISSLTSINLQYKPKDQFQNKRHLPIQNKNDENIINNIKFEKGIQIMKNLLPNKQNFRLRIAQKVKFFIQQLNLYFTKRNLKNISPSIIKIIADKSFYHEKQLSLDYQTKNHKNNQNFASQDRIQYQLAGLFYKKFCCFINKNLELPLIMPTNPYLLVWDILYLLIINSFLYLFSIYSFFGSNTKDSILGKFSYVVFFTVVFDRIISFNTAFYEKDAIVQKRQKIVEKNIFSLEFLIDLTVTAVIFFKLLYQALDSMTYNPNNKIIIYLINSFLFLLIYRNIEKKNKLSDVITTDQNSKHFFRLFTQIYNLFLIAHISAICMYILYLVEEYYQINNNWVNQANIQNSQFYEKYVYSLYWSITTMTTVGFGDILIQNYYEAIFICAIMILFSCVFAYSVSNIGVILQEIEKSSKQLQERQAIIQKFMNRKNINSSLKSRVKFYLNFLASEQKNRDKQEEDLVLGLLSNKLKNEIIEEINFKIINKYSLFMVNFQPKVIKELVYLMEEIIVAPNETIFKQNDIEDQSIYFIQSGIIEIFVTDQLTQTQKVIAQITSDSVFGEISFFSGLPRTTSARSLNLSTIYKINRQKFINFLLNFSEDFERYKMIQEQIICQKNLNCLYIKCYSCNQAGHITINCPIYFNSQTQILYQQEEGEEENYTFSDTSYDQSQLSYQSYNYLIDQRKISGTPTIKKLSSRQIIEKQIKIQGKSSFTLNNQSQEYENKNYSKNLIPEQLCPQNINQYNQNEQIQQAFSINRDCNSCFEAHNKSSNQIVEGDSIIKQQVSKSYNSSSSILVESKYKDKNADDNLLNIIQTQIENLVCDSPISKQSINQFEAKTLKNISSAEFLSAQQSNQLDISQFVNRVQKGKENENLLQINLNQNESQQNIQPQAISNIYQLNPRRNIFISQTSKQDIITLQKQCDLFDKIKIFKRFFPHNNADKVLKRIKQIYFQNFKQKKYEQRYSRISKQSNQPFQSSFKTQNCPVQKPSQASYGVYIKTRAKFPIKFN